jgi:hypothetical protein
VMDLQLTLDGREIPLTDAVAAPRSTSSLSAVQRAVLVYVGEHASITSLQAGRIVHAARGGGCARAIAEGKQGGCCKWASEDGRAMCMRLVKRGLLRRPGPGRWESIA